MKRIILLIGLVIFTCAQEKTPETSIDIQKEAIENLQLTIKLRSTSSDQFKVMLNKIKNEGNLINLHATKPLEGNNEIQEFNLSADPTYFPDELLIDFGKKPKNVTIEEIVFKTESFDLLIPKNKLDHFFYTNKFLKFNKDNLTYTVENNQKRQLLIFRQRVIDSLWLNR